MQRSVGGRRLGIWGHPYEQNPGPGHLYAVLGPDRVGKTTLVGAISAARNYTQARYDSGRDASVVAQKLKDIQLDMFDSGEVLTNPVMYEYVMTALCYETQEHVLLPALRAGHDIILDRWWPCALVYGSQQGLSKDFVFALKQHLIVPDAMLIISRDGVLPGRENKQNSFDTAEFQVGIRKGYEWLNSWWKRGLAQYCPIAMVKLPLDMGEEASARRVLDAFNRLRKEVTQ